MFIAGDHLPGMQFASAFEREVLNARIAEAASPENSPLGGEHFEKARAVLPKRQAHVGLLAFGTADSKREGRVLEDPRTVENPPKLIGL
jgi:hypothetical protein